METADTSAGRRPRRLRLTFYHPTQTGGGGAARLEFHPARPDRDGCFFLEMARQKTAPSRDADGRQTATFDWENKITAKLGFLDVCGLLLVLTGRGEQAGGGRGGLFHDTAEANTVINLRRQTEPAGFSLEVSRKAKRGDGEVRRARVLLTDAEALGLRFALEAALFPMVFGQGGEVAPVSAPA
jgi:hypothetical protein